MLDLDPLQGINGIHKVDQRRKYSGLRTQRFYKYGQRCSQLVAWFDAHSAFFFESTTVWVRSFLIFSGNPRWDVMASPGKYLKPKTSEPKWYISEAQEARCEFPLADMIDMLPGSIGSFRSCQVPYRWSPGICEWYRIPWTASYRNLKSIALSRAQRLSYSSVEDDAGFSIALHRNSCLYPSPPADHFLDVITSNDKHFII